MLPSPSADKQDYDADDLGHSEEDLFFWKPDFEQRRTRVYPSPQDGTASVPTSSADDGDAFEITVHNPEKKL